MSVPTPEQPGMPAPGENALRDLLGVLTRRLWIVLLALGLTIAVAVALSRVMPPMYEASSALIVYKNPPVVLLTNPYSGGESNLFQQQVAQGSDVVTVTEIVKSEAVREAAGARLASLIDPAQLKSILATLHVQQARSSDIVRISVTHTDPNAAAAVANAVVESVIDLDLKVRRHLVNQTRKYIGEQLAIATQRLGANERALLAYKNEHRDVSISEDTSLKLRQLAALEDKLADVRLQQREAQAGYVRSASLRPSASQSSPDPFVATLQSQLASLEVERSGLRKQFTPEHPSVLSVEAKIEETRTRLGAAISQSRAALAAREQKLSGDIGQVEQALAQIPTREAELARLTRDAKDAERTSGLLAAKLQEARIAEGSIGSAVQILDLAKPPQKPVWPKKGLILALAGVAGLLLGVTGAYAIEQVDESVKSAKEVERLLGAPVLSTIPVLKSRRGRDSRGAPPLAVPLDQTSRGAEAFEAFRSLRAHILGAMAKAQYKCLLITSAQRHEGKSTIVANLGIAVAQTDRRVLLVDCDLRRPALNRLFPGAESPGLSGILEGKADVSDVARSTPYPHLKCVVSGPAVHNPAELLDMKRMSEFMAQIRDQADLILLDTPAVLPVADAEVTAVHADAAIVVVRLGSADRRALGEVRHRLDRVGVRIIGLVVNCSRDRSRRYRY